MNLLILPDAGVPHLQQGRERGGFIFVLPPNATSGCNGCKSIHSKVKQFVLLELLLCVCGEM